MIFLYALGRGSPRYHRSPLITSRLKIFCGLHCDSLLQSIDLASSESSPAPDRRARTPTLHLILTIRILFSKRELYTYWVQNKIIKQTYADNSNPSSSSARRGRGGRGRWWEGRGVGRINNRRVFFIRDVGRNCSWIKSKSLTRDILWLLWWLNNFDDWYYRLNRAYGLFMGF